MVYCVATSTETQHCPKLQVLTSSYFPMPARSNHPKSIRSEGFRKSIVVPDRASENLKISVLLGAESVDVPLVPLQCADLGACGNASPAPERYAAKNQQLSHLIAGYAVFYFKLHPILLT